MPAKIINLKKEEILSQLQDYGITTFPLKTDGDYDNYKDSLVLIPVENISVFSINFLGGFHKHPDGFDSIEVLTQDYPIEPIIFSNEGFIGDGAHRYLKARTYEFSHLWGYCCDERLDAVQRHLGAIKVFIIE